MEAIAKGKNLRISLKNSILLCKKIKGLKLSKAKKFLEDLINQKISIQGKYYTKTAKEILKILKEAEANAKYKNLDIEKLFIKIAKADKGEKIIRPGRMGIRHGKGYRLGKSTHLEIVVIER